jgi:stage II sporulation protein D
MFAFPHRLRPAAAALLGALAGTLLALSGPGPAEAKVRFEIPGRGFGHGVGMSQWGAYGFAKHGRGHKRILRHYYKRTKLGRAKARQVRVLLSVRSSSVAFSGARRACGKRLKPGRTYRARLSKSGRKVRLERAGGKKLEGCGAKLGARPKRRIKIDGDGVYRGILLARAASDGLNVINKLGLEPYVKGVVPNEVPASWPAAALRAQAVAARSYALATGVDGEGFDAYDDTRSQVYVGVATEQASTNRAVRKTKRQVVKYRGKVIPAFFFSTSGGRTENVEYGFSGGTPRPYLKSVRDPYDKASPVHRWKVSYSRGKMERLLGGLVKGRLRRIKVTKTGVSPRIVKAKVIGSDGRRSVSGAELRSRLDLRSTWARFKRVKR